MLLVGPPRALSTCQTMSVLLLLPTCSNISLLLLTLPLTQHGGFLPAVKQLANVAALPGIVKVGRPLMLASAQHSTAQYSTAPHRTAPRHSPQQASTLQ